MIAGLEDFSLVSLAGYGGMIEDFVSYPANAKAVSGMPYRSLGELDEFLYPELSVLDPAWLTESVREIEWFRTHGLLGGFVNRSPVRGPKPPPYVTKDFLEEARKTVRGWADAWRNGPCVSGVAVDPDRIPTEWTPLGGGITVTWNGDGSFEGIPDGGQTTSILPAYLNPAKDLWGVLGRSAVRDFLSIRLFDRKKPFDNLEIPSFSWTDLGGKGSPGVDRRLLAKQILAVHSDCEKAAVLLVPMPNISMIHGERRTYSVLTVMSGQASTSSRIKEHKDCSDGCGTVVTREAGVQPYNSYDEATFNVSVNSGFCPDPSMLLGPHVTGPSDYLPVRLSETRQLHAINYGVDVCHDGNCDNHRHRAGDIWLDRQDYEWTGRMSGVDKELEISVTFPDWVEPRRVWLLVVARSRRLECTVTSGSYVVSEITGDTDGFTVSKGSFKSQLYVCAVPASVSNGAYLRVSGIPDVPYPRGSDFRHEVRLPDGGGSNGRQLFARQTVKIDNDYAEVVGVVGAIVDAKFTASVKD